MTEVKGVETNEFSRFIDHTLATPWETFISDVEKTLRSIQTHRSLSQSNSSRGTIEYAGIEFEVQKAIVGGSGWGVPEKLLRVFSASRGRQAVLFIYPVDQTTNTESVLNPSILSAFSIAIRSVPDLSCPVFFSVKSCNADNMDWMGYRPILLHSGSSALNSGKAITTGWSRYETVSYTFNKPSYKHPLYFFDGIRKVYQRRLMSLGLESDNRIFEQFATKITHYFSFETSQWLQSPEKVVGRPRVSLLPNLLNQDLDELIRMLLLRKVTFNMDNLASVKVAIEYRERKQYGVIDNESYSTLLPSRQHPNQWQLSPEWTPTPFQQPFSEHETMLLPWKSMSIRNLLVFLILSSFTKRQGDTGFNFENNYTLDEMLQGVQYEEMVNLVSLLSPATQNSFFQKIPTSSIVSAASTVPSSTVSSRSSSRSHTPATNGDHPTQRLLQAAAHRSLSSISSSTSLAMAAVAGGLSSPHTNPSTPHPPADASSQSTGSNGQQQQQQHPIENDRYFQPILRYLFHTEPSAPLAHQGLAAAGTGGQHVDLDLSAPSAMTEQSDSLRTLPPPQDTVQEWLEHFALIAGLLPTKTTNIIRLWQHCLRELQEHFDNKQLVPSFAQEIPSNNNKRNAVSERNLPLYERMLWDDVLVRKSDQEDIAVRLPSRSPSASLFSVQTSSSTSASTSSSLLLQKLQMIHFCNVVQDESAYYTPHPSAAKAASNTPDIVFPSLLRRIPLTEDMVAMQQHLAGKMYHETSRTLQQNPVLKFQVLLPTLLPDMLAFRTANPTLDLKAFYVWYGLDTAPKHLFATILDGLETDNYGARSSANTPTPMMSRENSEQVEGKNVCVGSEAMSGSVVDGEVVYDDRESFSEPLPEPSAGNKSSATSANPTTTTNAASVEPKSRDERIEERLLQELEGIWQLQTPPSPPSAPSANQSSAKRSSTIDEPVGIAGITNVDVSKCIFSAEKEMSKAVAYLERMQVAGLAEELIYLGVVATFRLVQSNAQHLQHGQLSLQVDQLREKILHLENRRRSYPSSAYSSIMRKHYQQQQQRQPRSSSSTQANMETVCTIHELCRLYDEIAEDMARIELLVYRVLQLAPLQNSFTAESSGHLSGGSGGDDVRSQRILSRWLQKRSYRLREEEEVEGLMAKIKSIFQTDHDWHSFDGRELGAPTAKKFVLRALLPQDSTQMNLRRTQRRQQRHAKRQQRRQRQQQRQQEQPPSGKQTDETPPAVRLDFSESLVDIEEVSPDMEGEGECAWGVQHSGSGSQDSSEDDNSVTGDDSGDDGGNDEAGRDEIEDDEEDIDDEEFDVGFTVFSDGRDIQALWEFMEE